jgi:putative DNA primase/helicase
MTNAENRPVEDKAASEEFGGSADQINPSEGEMDPLRAASSAVPAQKFRATSADTLAEAATARYLADIAGDPSVTPQEIRDALLDRVNGEYAFENMARKAAKSSSPPLVKVSRLSEHAITQVLLARRRIIAVDLAEGATEDMTHLATYVEEGENRGVYDRSEKLLRQLASELQPSLTSKGINSVIERLKTAAPVVRRTIEPHLIPVGNGVFDHARQELREFSPQWVFLSKIPAPYDPAATSPSITMPDGQIWTVDTWLASLSDDEEVVQLLWEIISACVRSNAPWNKSAWFMSERGNNGKGTLIQFLRNLLGAKACASVKFADFGRDFVMEPLMDARVNLVDENGVGAFADKIEDWKAFTTGDAFLLNRKFKTPVSIRWHGFEIQCLNSTTPRTKDRTESFYRRLLLVPFTNWFGDDERKYIKDDYLARPEVLAYVLRRALEMTHDSLSNPQVCRDALDAYRGNNNALQGFWEEFEPQLAWDLVPFRFLHDLYKEWFRAVNPSGQAESLTSLSSFLREHLVDSDDWQHKGAVAVRPGTLMAAPEPLIAEYGLQDWRNGSYSGSDPAKLCVPYPMKTNYKGLVRRAPSASRGGSADVLQAA